MDETLACALERISLVTDSQDVYSSSSSSPACSSNTGAKASEKEVEEVEKVEEPLPPIRLINFRHFKARRSYPRFPDDAEITTNLEDVDYNNSFVVFLSHCWLRGFDGAEGWDGRPHPDNASHEKFKLSVKAIERAWALLAEEMSHCYVWLDFGCINQDGDPAGELKQLDKIVQVCDTIITPIVDNAFREWELELSGKGYFEDYKAAAWREGNYAYVNRSWCRMEMLYAANVELHEATLGGTSPRLNKFKKGLRYAAKNGRRPHLLFGTRELATNRSFIIMEPLQNSHFEHFNPFNGSVTKESDREKIRELMAALTITRAVAGYEGDRNEKGQRHGVGRMVFENGNIYQGEWENDVENGHGVCEYTSGDVYTGNWTDGKINGQGRYDWADGEVNEGIFEGGVMNCKTGKCTYTGGDTFEGSWENDKKTGFGTYKHRSGASYVGFYANDMRNGEGTYTSQFGEKYTGNYRDDKRHGFGKVFDAHGKVLFEGMFAYNEPLRPL